MEDSALLIKNSFGRSSRSSNPFEEFEDIDADNFLDSDSDEHSFLIKQKKVPSYFRDSHFLDNEPERNSPFHRNVNTPVYDELEILTPKQETKRLFSFFKFETLPFKSKKSWSCFSKLSNFFSNHSSHFETVKKISLICYTLFCIFLFSLYGSNELDWNQTVISNKTDNIFSCISNSDHDSKSLVKFLKIKLDGPFLEEKDLSKTDINSGKYIEIELDSNQTWKLILKIPDSNGTKVYNKNTQLNKVFNLGKSVELNKISFKVNTNIKDYLSLNFNCAKLSDHYENSVIYSAILLFFVYSLIIFELTHRTLAACLGALGGISLISLIEMERPTLNSIVTWIEWETVLLMFGMMIIVAIFCETGLFDLIAVRIFHYSKSKVWIMIGSMCLLSAFLSAFLDNVTTILLLTPITIRLCEVMKLDPRIVIIAEVIFSNIGGAATAIGDPPNVIITANQVINSKGVDFSNFTFHMFVGSLFIYFVCYMHFRLLYADPNNFVKDVESEFDEMKKEITIWTRSFQSISPITAEEKIVRTLLKEKVCQLENLLTQKRYMVKQEMKKTLDTKSQEMIDNYKITNRPLLIKCSIVFSAALILFFIDPFVEVIHLSIGYIAILAALSLLAVSLSDSNGHDNGSSGIDFEGLMHKIEWSTLIFFSGLFVFMKCIEELGLLNFLGNSISDMIKSVHNTSDRLVFALLMLIVLSAFISSLIDNIPFTTAMIPIIIQLSDQANVIFFYF